MNVYILTLYKYCTIQVGKTLPQSQHSKLIYLYSNQVPAKDNSWNDTANIKMSYLIRLCMLIQCVMWMAK